MSTAAAPAYSLLAPPSAPPAPPASTRPPAASSSSSSGSRARGAAAAAAAAGANSTAASPRVEPSFRGILDSTLDALLLFEASRRGLIPRITRRLAEDQREHLIRSGSIFIFEEEESGIKRWTDGLIWSPSRILGNYLVYRQTEQRNSRAPRSGSTSKAGKKAAAAAAAAAAKAPPTPPSPTSDLRRASSPATIAVKKEPLVRPALPPAASAAKRSFSSTPSGLDPASLLGLSAPSSGAGLHQYFPQQLPRRRRDDAGDDLMEESDDEDSARDLEELMRIKERSLVGSLTNSYAFKEGGLVKRTMSMLIGSKTQHLVSYYTLGDGMTDQLQTPSSMPQFADMVIDPELLAKSQFRFPPVIELGQDGVLRYISEADNTQQSPASDSPAKLAKEPAPQPMPVVAQHPHPYYGHRGGPLSSSYPNAGLTLPMVDTTYDGALHFPDYSISAGSGAGGMSSAIGYGPPLHSTYSASSLITAQQWSSSLPKEFHHPGATPSDLHPAASIGSPFPPYAHPLPAPSKVDRSNSAGPGPQRRRRASQTQAAATVTTAAPEGRQIALTGSPFNQANRPLAAAGKPGFHPYAMPSPTEGWTAFHPSSNKSPSGTTSTRSSYFEGEPSVFAGGPLSGIASAPSSAGSSLSAGSGVGAMPLPMQQQASSMLTPAMNTAALGPPPSGSSANKRLSLNFPRDSKSYNSPRHRRSPSIQPSPLRTSAPLPYAVDDRARSPYPHPSMAGAPMQQQFGAPSFDFSTVAPHETQGSNGARDAPSSSAAYDTWLAAQQLQHPYGSSAYYDPHAVPPDALLPHEQHLGSHFGPRASPPPRLHAPASAFHPSSLLFNPMTSFADDKRSATLALDQLHFGAAGGQRQASPPDAHGPGGGDAGVGASDYHPHQVPSGMVAADDRRHSLANYSIQPPSSSSNQQQQQHPHQDEPAQRYWAV